MSKAILASPIITVAGTDLTDHIESVELSVGVDNAEVTAFGDSYRQHIPGGLKHWSCRLNFLQDYAGSKSYAKCIAMLTATTATTITVRPTTSTQSATNPTFSGDTVPDGDWNVIGGAVGEAHKFSVTLKGAGDLSFLTTATA